MNTKDTKSDMKKTEVKPIEKKESQLERVLKLSSSEQIARAISDILKRDK